MISSLDALREKKADILQSARKYGASNIRIFGSLARGEADEKSDIDFLIDLAPGRSLLELAGFIAALQEITGSRVDVVPSDCIKTRIREKVLREAIAL